MKNGNVVQLERVGIIKQKFEPSRMLVTALQQIMYAGDEDPVFYTTKRVEVGTAEKLNQSSLSKVERALADYSMVQWYLKEARVTMRHERQQLIGAIVHCAVRKSGEFDALVNKLDEIEHRTVGRVERHEVWMGISAEQLAVSEHAIREVVDELSSNMANPMTGRGFSVKYRTLVQDTAMRRVLTPGTTA